MEETSDEIPIVAAAASVEETSNEIPTAALDEDQIHVVGNDDIALIQYPKEVEEEVMDYKPIIFEENITITLGQPHSFVEEADAFVNFCMGNIHSGNDTFMETHRLSGGNLKNACLKYRGVQPGFARITDAYELKNFKHIIHGILPMVDTKFVGAAPSLTYLCIISVLDCAMENNVKSLILPSLFAIEPNISCYLTLLAIKKWKNDNPARLERIIIVCEHESDFLAFHHQIPAIALIEDFSTDAFDEFFPSLQYSTGGYPAYHDGEQYEYNPNDATYTSSMSLTQPLPGFKSIEEQRSFIHNLLLHEEEPDTKEIHEFYQKMFYLSDGGIRLQHSRNLSITVLPIEEPDGQIRQYRLTTQTPSGFYYRCSRCDSLNLQTATQYHPKMSVKNGSIVGNYYPLHHPQCHPLTKRKVILQQIDRQAKCKVMDQNMVMTQMYEQENGIFEIEINEADLKQPQEAEENAEVGANAHKVKFPTWEKVRKQYYRHRARGVKSRHVETQNETAPILVDQNEEETITTDLIQQQTEREFNAEEVGMNEEEKEVKNGVTMYHHPGQDYTDTVTGVQTKTTRKNRRSLFSDFDSSSGKRRRRS